MDTLAAVGDPQLRETLLWVRGRPAAVTADEVASAQGIHRNVARSRLERLAGAGLLVVDFERRTGRVGPGAGRPAKTYAAAPELASAEFPSRGYERLLGLLLETLPARGRAERLRTVGVDFGRSLAAEARPTSSLRTGAERVCRALRRLGYQAAVEQSSATEAVIATPMCPLRPLTCAHRDAAAIDRGMWAGLVAAATGIAPEAIRCELHDCLDGESACRVHIELTSSFH